MGGAKARGDVHVALLRGINVGGKNRLAMADLVALFAHAGCTDVATYIQSGNVVFRASEAIASRVAGVIARALSEQMGLRTPVVTRTARELRAAVRCNPFTRAGADSQTLHVAFLADRPARGLVAGLDPARSLPDRFEVRGREIFLCCPGGMGRSRLTNEYFDRKLATTSTIRNWRTVLELAEMCAPR